MTSGSSALPCSRRAGGRNRAGSQSDNRDRETMFKKAYRSGLLFLLLLACYSRAAGATFSSTHFRYTYDVALLTRTQADSAARDAQRAYDANQEIFPGSG